MSSERAVSEHTAILQDRAGRVLAELRQTDDVTVSGTVTADGKIARMLANGEHWPVVLRTSRTKRRDVVRLNMLDVYAGCTIHLWMRLKS